MSTIALSPAINDLDAFLASMGVGYLLADIEHFDLIQVSLPSLQVRCLSDEGIWFLIPTVYNNLIDPPFVHGVWSAAQFQVGDPYSAYFLMTHLACVLARLPRAPTSTVLLR